MPRLLQRKGKGPVTKAPLNCIILPRYSLTFKHAKKPRAFEEAGLRCQKEETVLVKFKKKKSIHIFKQLCRGILRLFTDLSHTQLMTTFPIKLNSSALEEFPTATLALHLCKGWFKSILSPQLSPNPPQEGQRLTPVSAACLSFCAAPYSSARPYLSSVWRFPLWCLRNVLSNASTCCSVARTGQTKGSAGFGITGKPGLS